MKTLALVLAAIVLLPAVHAEADAALEFVTLELGDVTAKAPVTATFRGTFADASAETHVTALNGQGLDASVSIPAPISAGSWSVDLADAAGASLLHVAGVLSADGIQILESRVDSTRLDLPRDTTSLRVIKGYVSATVTLVGSLKEAGCCKATLSIDADADGAMSDVETRTVQAEGDEVRAVLALDRVAPTVPYVFTIQDASGRTVATASGTYSFTKLNGVSTTGEFDPAVVAYVTGNVDRVPHLLQHDIGSGILLQSVSGSARDEEGPRVFFTMGTPTTEPASVSESAAVSEGGPSLWHRVVALFTGPVFLAILLGALAAALLALAAKRLMDRTY